MLRDQVLQLKSSVKSWCGMYSPGIRLIWYQTLVFSGLPAEIPGWLPEKLTSYDRFLFLALCQAELYPNSLQQLTDLFLGIWLRMQIQRRKQMLVSCGDKPLLQTDLAKLII